MSRAAHRRARDIAEARRTEARAAAPVEPVVPVGLRVSRCASEFARGQADIDALIDVNRTIMEGLATQRGRRCLAAREILNQP